MVFKQYTEEDYEAICQFLIELNRESKDHINWNWARWEWMAEHPEFDKESQGTIGLWMDDGRIVGAAIYDMYFGEAFAGALLAYRFLYKDILEYAYHTLKDEGGIGVSICDGSNEEIRIALECGFTLADQREEMMRIDTSRNLSYQLPEGFQISELDPKEKPYEFQWILWQGFDHGEDEKEFRLKEEIRPQIRRHLKKELSLSAVDAEGKIAGYCCLWYNEQTDYAYVEPVCTAPSYRGMGIAKALVYEALGRVREMGAKSAYVISDLKFYQKLEFETDRQFTFYWKE